jgi:hypothetical protein
MQKRYEFHRPQFVDPRSPLLWPELTAWVRALHERAALVESLRLIRKGIRSLVRYRNLGRRVTLTQLDASAQANASAGPDATPNLTPPPPRSRAEIQKLLDEGRISLVSAEGAHGLEL